MVSLSLNQSRSEGLAQTPTPEDAQKPAQHTFPGSAKKFARKPDQKSDLTLVPKPAQKPPSKSVQKTTQKPVKKCASDTFEGPAQQTIFGKGQERCYKHEDKPSTLKAPFVRNWCQRSLSCRKCVAVLFLCVVLSGIISSGEATQQVGGRNVTGKGVYPDDFLLHFGYLSKAHYYHRYSRLARRRAVGLYQQNNGLTVTGRVNRQTWRMMQKPRCGNPDVGALVLPDMTPDNRTAHRRLKRSFGKRAEKLDAHDYRWLHRRITWSATRFFQKLPVASQWHTLKKAFDIWSEPSQLTLAYDPVNPDIHVGFWRREHGDGYENAFDGRGMLLAHAFPPGDGNLSGDIHFDSDEKWSVGKPTSDNSKDLLMIALHEVGHSIGLSHSSKKKDIMFPLYGSFTPHPTLSRHDVKRLRRLYGKNPAFKWTPPPAVPPAHNVPQLTVRRMTPRWCRMPFNDVIRGPHGRGYIFSKRHVYRFSSKGVEEGYPVHIRQEFPGAPINPLAVVHVHKGAHTFFFKGWTCCMGNSRFSTLLCPGLCPGDTYPGVQLRSPWGLKEAIRCVTTGKRVWRFTKYQLDKGYPKILQPAFPEKPRAAINIRNRIGYSSVFILGRRLFWQWNHKTEKVSSAPRYIKKFWRALPSKVDAAVHWSDRRIYFFKNNKYYKFIHRTHTIVHGYPKIKGPAWLRGDCGHTPK